jgi:class 3 adenylate cyclase
MDRRTIISVSRVADPIEAGRDALQRRQWREAYDLLMEADQAGSLSADGIHLLAEAAWWAGQPDGEIELSERAFEAYLQEGNKSAAAMTAFEVAWKHAGRLSLPVANGWLGQAARLVADDPDSPLHGYLAWIRGFLGRQLHEEVESVIASFDEALEVATRTGDRNLRGISLLLKGETLVRMGKIVEGQKLIDEAMAATVGGELDPKSAGFVYCSMISLCSDFGDYRRAAEWTDATIRWCERNSISAFPGICRIHRAELLRLRGEWPPAEEEARKACDELPRFNFLFAMGFAFYEIGEIRRRMGDFAGAEEAYGRAHEFGRDPQPGLSLLRLAQGKVEAAFTGIRRALDDAGEDRLQTLKPLAALVEIALAANEIEIAATAAEDLDSVTQEYASTAHQAVSAYARGSVRLARADWEGAIRDFRSALNGWQQVDAPYEAAEVRVALAKGYRASGDDEAALMELRAARTTFERLGARWAAHRAGELLAELASSQEAPERVRRAFMFTDIVKSTDLVGVIGDEAWESLLGWHDQTLRSLFAAHNGSEVNHTGDGFFVSFDDSRSALRCAVDVQRRLAEHRRTQGFAPMVRIGVHVAEATRRGQDYGGSEVHKAARIAALAEGGEILASAETLADADGGFPVSEARDVSLKGVAGPVEVARVDWR